MSANPRSPESGDVPEKDVAEMPDHLLVLSVVNASFDLGAWNRDTATTPYEVEVLRQRRYVNELHRRLAELSTARARADSAEAQAARLRRAGRALANMAYNFAQRPHYMLTDRDCTLFRESCDAWDAAIASTPIPDGEDRAE